MLTSTEDGKRLEMNIKQVCDNLTFITNLQIAAFSELVSSQYAKYCSASFLFKQSMDFHRQQTLASPFTILWKVPAAALHQLLKQKHDSAVPVKAEAKAKENARYTCYTHK